MTRHVSSFAYASTLHMHTVRVNCTSPTFPCSVLHSNCGTIVPLHLTEANVLSHCLPTLSGSSTESHKISCLLNVQVCAHRHSLKLMRAMSCYNQAFMVVDTSTPGWRILHANDCLTEQTGVTPPFPLSFFVCICFEFI